MLKSSCVVPGAKENIMAEKSVFYAKMLSPQVNARFGKMAEGRIVPLDEETYQRWEGLGLVEASSEKAYTDYREKRASAGGGGEKGTRLRELAAQRSAEWDVATNRDALTAPPEALDRSRKAGRPLVNVDQLRDEDGMPLQPDAKIDEILEGRKRLQERDPLREHTQSSVFGGGSHYYTPAPLNAPDADVKTLASGELDHAQEHPSRSAKRTKKDAE
jgi:hypothetical protein